MRILKSILIYVVVSLAVSFFIFVISLSSLTGKFPPDLNMITSTYKSFKGLVSLSKHDPNMYGKKKNKADSDLEMEESDIQVLNEFNRMKALLGSGVFGNLSANESMSDLVGQKNPSQKDFMEIKNALQENRSQIDKLQQRILQLESEVRTLQSVRR